MDNQDFACTVAALVLVDDDIAVTSEKIAALLKASNIEMESIWPRIFAEKLGANVKDLITNVSFGAGTSVAVSAAPVTGAPVAVVEKKEEKVEKEEEEEDDDMGFGLFD